MTKPAPLSEWLLIFLVALVGFGYFPKNPDPNTDSRLSLVKAIVEEGDFIIDTYQLNIEFSTIDRAYFDGHYYSDKAIGASLLGALAYYPIYQEVSARRHLTLPKTTFEALVTFFAISLLCALLAPLIYEFTRQVGGSHAALFSALALLFGTGLWRYSSAFYGHTLAGLCFFAAFFIWHQAKNRGAISHEWGFFSGFLLGFMVITEYPTALLAVITGIYILFVLKTLHRLLDWRLYLWLGLGFLLPAGFLLYYNAACFGNPLAFGYQYLEFPSFASGQAQGLAGIGWPDLRVMFDMTFQPMEGIFWQSPVLLLALTGYYWMFKRPEYRAEMWLSLSASLLYCGLISGYYLWWGGLAYTPRHLLPVLPALAVPLAFLPQRLRKLGWVAALISIAQSLLATATRFYLVSKFLDTAMLGKYVVTTKSLLFHAVLPDFLQQHFLVNPLIAQLGLRGWAISLPLLLVETLLLAVLLRAIGNPNR